MLYNETSLAKAIASHSLPDAFLDLFGTLLDQENHRFIIQESTIIDFKEGIPSDFTSEYGSCIVRLALGFYNTAGGSIVFGVKDRSMHLVGEHSIFDIESFNRCISDFTGDSVECLLKQYMISHEGGQIFIPVVLVPQRQRSSPAHLLRKLGPYPAGALWVRERHEVIEAKARHLPLLYSNRPPLSDNLIGARVHRSLPPSPATMQEFVGRFELLRKLWDWLVAGNNPRIYLHGPGGSGKSTLAYEFARAVAEAELPIRMSDGSLLDYVIYLSAKETVFNPIDQTESAYQLRQFTNSDEQFAQILFHSGMLDTAGLGEKSPDQLMALLNDLTNNFSGLIILDDIDALSRRGAPTGEEELFLRSALAARQTRILYTLRYAPAYALTSALDVPSLDGDREYYDFVEACSAQFDVSVPSAEFMIKIAEETDRLPLLIETIIGLRRTSSNYHDAIKDFRERGGEAARRYLYQREYDKLDGRGRSRQLLAALMLIDAPVSFRSVCDILPNLPRESVRDAISETKGIFLRTDQDDGGDTQYELSESSKIFVKNVSQELPYFANLKRSVQHYKNESITMSAAEASALARVNALIREKRYNEIVDYCQSLAESDSIRVNPQFLGIVGQAYAALGASFAENAREYFRRAYALHERNIFMIRSWFYLEFNAPHTVTKAEELCRSVINDESLSVRHRAEFYSKLGRVLDQEAQPHSYTARERAIALSIESINSYLEAAWLAKDIRELDNNHNERWLVEAVGRFFKLVINDPEPIFQLIESWVNFKHDIEFYAARIILEPLKATALNVDPARRARFSGLAKRTQGKLAKLPRKTADGDGFVYVLSIIKEIATLT